MEFSNLYLKAISHSEPDEFVSSDQIEQRLAPVYDKLKLPYGRIEMQTGIQTRGVYHQKLPSDIATSAAKNLIAENQTDIDSIDLLINASVCRNFLEPATASVIHHELGLKETCPSFDLSNACLGVMSAIEFVAHGIIAGKYNNVLIVSGENATPLLDQTIMTVLGDATLNRKSIKKYFANFTIGSAGVALLIGRDAGIAQIKDILTLSDTSANVLCQGSGDMNGLVMETDSEELKEKGVALALKNWKNFQHQSEFSDWDHFVCHQVGIHHQDYLYKVLELEKKKDFSSFQKYGNTGSAALPLTLSLAAKKNIYKKDDHIALLGIGSGLNTTMMGMQWKQ